MAYTRKITAIEARVLGVLMEKEEATPEGYPLSLNALVAACNQKTSRDPVMQLDEEQVTAALEELRRDVLVWRSEGARVVRWDHRLVNRWHLDKPAKAVITLLLLRGAQTPGELRTRSDRLGGFTSVEDVERVLERLSRGDNALVRKLPHQPGQRESRWQHTMLVLDDAAVADAAVAAAVAVAQAQRSAVATSVDASDTRQQAVGAREHHLESRVAELEERVAELERRWAELEGG
jgi:hypothetical protein